METNVIHTLSAGAGETISICFYNKKLTYNIIYTQIHTYIYIYVTQRYGHNTDFLPPQLIDKISIQNDAPKLRFAKLDL